MERQRITWDPAKYVQFGNFRDRPFFDLTGRIAALSPRRVVDLGCGPGTLTAALARRWPDADVVGVDSSAEMVATAGAMADRPANLSFEQGDIAGWMPEPGTDVLVSNAALQWVPGHQDLMRRWLAVLEPGAWLAVQVPGNFASPSHVLMRQLAESARWSEALDGVLRHDDAVWEPGQYQQLLLHAGCDADVWESTFHQLLAGERPVLEWVRGTALRPVMAALDTAEGEAFEAEYAKRLGAAYPPGPDGTIFPFRRIFMVGRKR
ncbi:trans-aconitate 2-methyltransferase [Arthrobacter sp. 35W]|uniref:trans-aconitate 2-methyltransferase n=1 Tax=Arthrobacter sp. 35W TaxID=1132441 RepID=UPI0004119CD3|nr:trans-aconitate 2-methyltransferase [Arthrobacter sp. 35W]